MTLVFTEIFVLLLLLVANGVFAMTEIAIVSARKPRLRSDYSMRTQVHIVGHHHKVVELDTLPDVGAAHGSPVNGGIGTYFHVIADPVSTCVHEIRELTPLHKPRLVTKL